MRWTGQSYGDVNAKRLALQKCIKNYHEEDGPPRHHRTCQFKKLTCSRYFFNYWSTYWSFWDWKRTQIQKREIQCEETNHGGRKRINRVHEEKPVWISDPISQKQSACNFWAKCSKYRKWAQEARTWNLAAEAKAYELGNSLVQSQKLN